MSKEIIKYLPTKQGSPKAAAIKLPWGNVSRKAGVQSMHTEKLEEIPHIGTAIAVENTKELCNITSNNCTVSKTAIGVNLKASPSEQHGDKHEPKHTLTPRKKEIDSNLKSHRHCPKIRNDFFMELKRCNKSKSTNNILYHQNVRSQTK
jgi:hypothetical protein